MLLRFNAESAKPTWRLAALLFSLLAALPAFGKSFHGEGSDLLMGVGAEAMALGGAVCASTQSIYSVYWNPAGLAELEENQISLSGQLNAKFLPVNFAGVAFPVSWLDFAGLKSTLALSWIPRLHVKSSGAYTTNDLESMFLRFAMPDLPGNFDGTIQSKTKDYRLTWAITPRDNPRWSLGLTVSRIECGTSFCGVTADDPGNYKVKSTNATAIAVNAGGKYFYSDNLVFGFNIKDISTTLDVGIVTINQNGTREYMTVETSFPRDITIGMLWRYNPALNLSLDLQSLYGTYGRYKVDFRIVRSGIEYAQGRMRYRFGLIVPLMLKTDKITDYKNKLPFPAGPTAGIGWQGKRFNVDLVLYAQPLMSAQRKRLYPAVDLSVITKF